MLTKQIHLRSAQIWYVVLRHLYSYCCVLLLLPLFYVSFRLISLLLPPFVLECASAKSLA